MAHFAQSPYFVLHQLTCQFANGETLFGPLNLAVEQQHCGLVGRNGVGKTRLLRLIAGLDQPASGHIETQATFAYVAQQPHFTEQTTLATLLAYLDQDLFQLDLTRSVVEHLGLQDTPLAEGVMRSQLAQLQLNADRVTLPLAALSGGERLKAALAGFPGAMLVVSHDEDFLQALRLTHRLSWSAAGWCFQAM